jgi:hypothetical protein
VQGSGHQYLTSPSLPHIHPRRCCPERAACAETSIATFTKSTDRAVPSLLIGERDVVLRTQAQVWICRGALSLQTKESTTMTTNTIDNSVSSAPSAALSAHVADKFAFFQSVLNSFTSDIFANLPEDDTQSPDSRIGMGETSKMLADRFGTSVPDMSALLSFLLEGYPNLRTRQGKHGGYYRVSKNYVDAVPQDKASKLAKQLEDLRAAQEKAAKKHAKLVAEQARLGLNK